jgi:hypothetical protein
MRKRAGAANTVGWPVKIRTTLVEKTKKSSRVQRRFALELDLNRQVTPACSTSLALFVAAVLPDFRTRSDKAGCADG